MMDQNEGVDEGSMALEYGKDSRLITDSTKRVLKV